MHALEKTIIAPCLRLHPAQCEGPRRAGGSLRGPSRHLRGPTATRTALAAFVFIPVVCCTHACTRCMCRLCTASRGPARAPGESIDAAVQRERERERARAFVQIDLNGLLSRCEQHATNTTTDTAAFSSTSTGQHERVAHGYDPPPCSSTTAEPSASGGAGRSSRLIIRTTQAPGYWARPCDGRKMRSTF